VTPRLDRRADLFRVSTRLPVPASRTTKVEGGPLGDQVERASTHLPESD